MYKWDKLSRNKKLHKMIKPTTDLNAENKYVVKETMHEGQEEYEIVEMEILPEKIICPDCGGITLEGLEFCDKCGGEL